MGKIQIDSLSPGMVLENEVRDRSGRLLLGAGTGLSEKHIYILRTWGVIEVEIEGADDESCVPNQTNKIDPARWAALEDKITPLFLYMDKDHPAVKELMRMRILREVENAEN